MTAKEKMTAPIASVGADVEQPLQNLKTNQSIADLPGKGNLQAKNNAENTAKSANKKNPDDLETVSMMELYDTAYPPKLPIVDGLLYNGTYLFVGSPKIGNHSLWHRLDITSVKDFHCGAFQSDRERFSIWHWKMIMQGCRSDYHRCLEWKAVRIFISLQNPNRSMTDWKNSL